MQHTTPEEQWSIIIDTNSYSGNFEREMGAYITGLETIRGELFVHDIRNHYGFDEDEDGDWYECEKNPYGDIFRTWPGDHGEELANICPTPEYKKSGKKVRNKDVYQSVQIRTSQRPTEEQIKVLKEWAYRFAAKTQESRLPYEEEKKAEKERGYRNPFFYQTPIDILGFRLTCDRTTTEEILLGP